MDEITFVEDWWRAIKSRIDLGKFKRDVIYISGSASIEILKQKERFPGRIGYGKDIYFYPMDFAEYVYHFAGIKTDLVSIRNIEKWLRKIEALKVFEKKLSEMFSNYSRNRWFSIGN